MNFLLPLLVGGPDMANKRVSSRGIINNKRCYNTSAKNPNLNSYLSGLFEGCGHILIQNSDANDKKRDNPRFCITFSLKNEPLTKKLLDIIVLRETANALGTVRCSSSNCQRIR